MFEKIRKRVLKQRYRLYHKIGNYCYGKAYKCGPTINQFWAGVCTKFVRKEFEMFRKLKGRDTCY